MKGLDVCRERDREGKAAVEHTAGVACLATATEEEEEMLTVGATLSRRVRRSKRVREV